MLCLGAFFLYIDNRKIVFCYLGSMLVYFFFVKLLCYIIMYCTQSFATFRKFLTVTGDRLRCPLALIQHDARHPNELGALPEINDDQIRSGRQNVATTVLAIFFVY